MKYDMIIAEDDAILREIYLRKFDHKKFTIRTAANGEEVLKLLSEKEPLLLLLDINMPVIDGIEVLKKLPKAKRHFSVIMLTNLDAPDMKQEAEKLGADGYFVKKSMTLESLLKMSEDLLSRQES